MPIDDLIKQAGVSKKLWAEMIDFWNNLTKEDIKSFEILWEGNGDQRIFYIGTKDLTVYRQGLDQMLMVIAIPEEDVERYITYNCGNAVMEFFFKDVFKDGRIHHVYIYEDKEEWKHMKPSEDELKN